jgi:outer membrane protein OmpA-like peptidoglycan-associated protein
MQTATTIAAALGAATLLTIAGCAPRSNAALERARAAYRDASQDPGVSRDAPVALHEAEQALQKADRAHEKGEDEKDVNSLAYVAERKVDVARAAAAEKQADTEAESLRANRDTMVLHARTGEARLERERARGLEDQLRQLHARETPRGTVITLNDVLFEFDKAELKPGAMRDLSRLADVLKQEPDRQVMIEGYTDSVGSSSYNRELAESRAQAVRDFLIQHGVGADRITARGYGKDYPVATNDTEAGRQQNRRVEVVILPPGQSATSGAGRQPRTPEAEPVPPY